MGSQKQLTSQNNQKRQRQALSLGLVGVGLVLLAVALGLFWGKDGSSEAAAVPTPAQEQVSQSSELPAISSTIPSEVSFPAPDLALRDLMGAERALKDYTGQVVLVNNWAVWCPPCKAEIPHLEAYFQAHKEDGFIIIGIDAGDAESKVTDYVSQAGISYPIWFDPDGDAMSAFRNDYLPSSYVIDRTGNVILAWTGSISLEVLEAYITPLLAD